MNKNYKVKCKFDHGDLFLSVTHNGYQWFALTIKNPDVEIPLIISELQRHLTSAIHSDDRDTGEGWGPYGNGRR